MNYKNLETSNEIRHMKLFEDCVKKIIHICITILSQINYKKLDAKIKMMAI